MKITALDHVTVSIPVRPFAQGGIAPYRGARDPKGTSHAVSTLFKVTTASGAVGWGEMSPFLAPSIMTAVVEDYLKPRVIGRDLFRLSEIMADFDPLYTPHLNTRVLAAGLEMALWDAIGRETRRPIADFFGGRRRDTIAVAWCFGITGRQETVEFLARARDAGVGCVKTKAGADIDADLERADWLANAAGGSVAVRVDMNQNQSLADALRYVRGIEGMGFQFIEQPIAVNDPKGLRSLRYRGTTPIAINEDAYVPQQLLRLHQADAFDVAVLDLDHGGGLLSVARQAALAEEARIPLAQHCGWDLGIKVAAILQLSAALPVFSYEMDSTYFAHADDVLSKPLASDGGAFRVPEGPGLGVQVDEAKVKRYRVA